MPTKDYQIRAPATIAGVGVGELGGYRKSGSTVQQAGMVVPVDPDTHDPIIVGGYPVALAHRESFAYFTANERMSRIIWRVPTGKRFYPTLFLFSGVTGGGGAELCAARMLGSWNMSTNVYTDGPGAAFANVGAGQSRFWERVSSRIRTTMSAIANGVNVATLTSTGAIGSANVTFLASSPVNHVLSPATQHTWPLFNGADPAAADTLYGIRDVTGASDSAAPTGIVDFFGETVLAGGRHAANDSFTADIVPGSCWIDADDFIIVHGLQPAVTAYQREFYVSGILTDVPA